MHGEVGAPLFELGHCDCGGGHREIPSGLLVGPLNHMRRPRSPHVKAAAAARQAAASLALWALSSASNRAQRTYCTS